MIVPDPSAGSEFAGLQEHCMSPLSVCRPREIEFRADLVGGYYSIMILGSKLPDQPTVVIIKHRFDERSSFGHSLV